MSIETIIQTQPSLSGQLSQVMSILINLIGIALIWAACDVKRGKESKIKVLSKWWFLQLLLIVIGIILYNS